MSSKVYLHRLNPNPNKYDGSTWVNRLDAFLTMSDTKFEYKSGTFNSSKTGKMPYIVIGDEQIPDSLVAYEELIKRGLATDLDEGISEDAKAKGRAVESLVTELYWIGVKERWVDNYYPARDKFGLARLPYPLRFVIGNIAHRKIVAYLAPTGHLQRTPEEVAVIRDSAMDALDNFVGKNEYLAGLDHPTRADALLLGVLMAYLGQLPDWAPSISAAFSKRQNLMRYAANLSAKYFPNRDVIKGYESKL